MKSLVVILAVALSMQAQALQIVSKDGGKCLSTDKGAKEEALLIVHKCKGGDAENFVFDQSRLKLNGTELCAEAVSRDAGTEIRLAKCDFSAVGTSLQNFAQWPDMQIGHNTGLVLDYEGGWLATPNAEDLEAYQRVVLNSNKKQSHQKWKLVQLKTSQTTQTQPKTESGTGG